MPSNFIEICSTKFILSFQYSIVLHF